MHKGKDSKELAKQLDIQIRCLEYLRGGQARLLLGDDNKFIINLPQQVQSNELESLSIYHELAHFFLKRSNCDRPWDEYKEIEVYCDNWAIAMLASCLKIKTIDVTGCICFLVSGSEHAERELELIDLYTGQRLIECCDRWRREYPELDLEPFLKLGHELIELDKLKKLGLY